MATLGGMSAATVAAFNNSENLESTSELKKLKEALEDTEDETIPWGEEPIFKEVLYCHQSEQGRGLMTPGNLFNMGLHPTDIPKVYGEMPYKGPSFQFKELNSVQECLDHNKFSGCLKWKGRWGGCREYNDGIGIAYKKMKVVGSRKVKDPIKITYSPKCSFVGRKRVKNNKDIVFYECEDVEASREQMPRENVDRPHHTDVYPQDTDSKDLAKSIEAAAPWIAAEIARAQYGNIMGSNFLPGNKRIYVIWEKITCDAPFIKVTVKHDFGEQSIYKDLPETGVKNPDYSQFESAGPSCRTAIRYELYKRFQTKYMRDWCDLLGKGLGEPFKY